MQAALHTQISLTRGLETPGRLLELGSYHTMVAAGTVSELCVSPDGGPRWSSLVLPRSSREA